MPAVHIRDIEMYYKVHGNASSEPLVLLHGFTSSGQSAFGHLLPRLGEQYRLYLPDVRGHGRTTNPGGVIHHSELALDTSAFAHSMDLDRAHFCCHSSGRMQLPFLAIEHPELVHSLTLVSATYTFDDHVKVMARKNRATASSEWVDHLNTIYAETHGSDYADTILDLWVESVLRPDELPFIPEDLSEITCPTLVIHGDRDAFFPIHVPVTMYQSTPKSELCILPNCNHGLPAENPNLFATNLLEFLARNPFPD